MAKPRCRHVYVRGLLPFIMVAALIKLSFPWVVRSKLFLTPGTQD